MAFDDPFAMVRAVALGGNYEIGLAAELTTRPKPCATLVLRGQQTKTCFQTPASPSPRFATSHEATRLPSSNEMSFRVADKPPLRGRCDIVIQHVIQ